MLSKFNKNCVLTGYVDHYCLVCEFFMDDITQVGFHIKHASHIENLQKTLYITKYSKDFIRKVPLGYYCELCNILLHSLLVLPFHIKEEDHVLHKAYNHIERMPNWISVKRVENFILIFDDIALTKTAWNTIIDDSCCLCNKEFTDINQHYNEQEHILKLIQSVLQVDFHNNIYRKIDHHHFHCVTCNSFLPETAFLGHFLSYEHKSMRLKCRKVMRSQRMIGLNSGTETFMGTSPEEESILQYRVITNSIEGILEPATEENKLTENLKNTTTYINDIIPRQVMDSTELISPVCKRYKNEFGILNGTDYEPQSFSSQNGESNTPQISKQNNDNTEPQSSISKNVDNNLTQSSILNNIYTKPQSLVSNNDDIEPQSTKKNIRNMPQNLNNVDHNNSQNSTSNSAKDDDKQQNTTYKNDDVKQQNTTSKNDDDKQQNTTYKNEDVKQQNTTSKNDDDKLQNTASKNDDVKQQNTTSNNDDDKLQNTTSQNDDDKQQSLTSNNDDDKQLNTTSKNNDVKQQNTTSKNDDDKLQNTASKNDDVKQQNTTSNNDDDKLQNTASKNDDVKQQNTTSKNDDDKQQNTTYKNEDVKQQNTTSKNDDDKLQNTASKNDDVKQQNTTSNNDDDKLQNTTSQNDDDKQQSLTSNNDDDKQLNTTSNNNDVKQQNTTSKNNDDKLQNTTSKNDDVKQQNTTSKNNDDKLQNTTSQNDDDKLQNTTSQNDDDKQQSLTSKNDDDKQQSLISKNDDDNQSPLSISNRSRNIRSKRKLHKLPINKKKSKTVSELTSDDNVPTNQDRCENVNVNTKTLKNNVTSEIVNVKTKLPTSVPLNEVKCQNVTVNTKISNKDKKISGKTRPIRPKKEFDFNKIFQTTDYIYGSHNLGNHSCLLCHTALGEENTKMHINSVHHKSLLKLRNEITLCFNVKSPDDAPGNIVIEDWSEDELETPEKKVTHVTIETDKKKTRKKSVNNENDAVNVELKALMEFAKENDITYSTNYISFCRVCKVDVPNHMKNFTEHVNGVKHTRSLIANKSVGNLEKDVQISPVIQNGPVKENEIVLVEDDSVNDESTQSSSVESSNGSETQSTISIKHYKTQTMSEFMHTMSTIETKYRHDLVINDKLCIDMTSFCMWFIAKDSVTCYACDVKFDYKESLSHLQSKKHMKAMTDTLIVTSFPRDFIREIRQNVFHCGFCNIICDAWDDLQRHVNTDRHQNSRITHAWYTNEHVYCFRSSVVKRVNMSIDTFINKFCIESNSIW